VTRLRQLRTAHLRGTRRLTSSISGWRQQVSAKTRLADDCDMIVSTASRHSDPAWHGQRGQVIPGQDVAGYLARQVADAMASAGSYVAATWRGLRLGFDAERQWRNIRPFATIRAGGASLTVELNPAWIAKGQHWRIEKEIKSAVGDAGRRFARLRAEAEDLSKRIADAGKRVGEPFPHAAELEAARARRDAIEQSIRDTAAPQDNDGEPIADLSDELASADDREAAEVYAIDTIDATDDTGRILLSSIQSLPERAAPAAGAAVTVAEPALPTRPDRRQLVVAQLDGTAEPLFALPAAPPPCEQPARPRRPRRPATQGAHEQVIQPALFDFPAESPAPTRASADQAGRQARRR